MGSLPRGGAECPYLIGDIYITTRSENPSSLWTGTTWEKVGSGRALMGADSSHGVGTTVDSGLPNITGAFGGDNVSRDVNLYANGAFNSYSGYSGSFNAGSYTHNLSNGFKFNASWSNPIYGRSTIVQPPAFFCNFWKRLS